MSKLNVELLRRVQTAILEEPRKLNMNVWMEKVPGRHPNPPPCGTVGCIAGWAVALGAPEKRYLEDFRSYADEASALLGLDEGCGSGLFYYAPSVRLSPGTLPYAEDVAARIDTYIEEYSPKEEIPNA